ncbi:phytanoyl-CoA dioxygenase family protein [Bauldia litoralis]|uniref:Ectoine hydroxylase-related dioxygenase, phytanoyl-CoA dioxygenase (PhyH) family n=1 Tax=Bauldia litoralis TaxID=665467 RepID=A0A1G6DYV1_9HYPH|nr:phytanoyl-CoA dioxygenase family protein [Bauldia litoralis]SDB50334.1 Ectoine hydroxylase-related dioxygenase, phytanoyl-CoA dioxygenase (PhyH) family [Bauldia litoralis]
MTIENTAQALDELGIGPLTDEQKRLLDEQGYFIVENVFSPEEVAEMRDEVDRLAAIEGEFGGHEVHIEPGASRLSNLFNKSPAFDRCLTCAPTLAAAHYLLGEIHVGSLNERSPGKGSGQQHLHSDLPRIHATDWRGVNSMVMLDDMTEENGPTRIVPGSHKWSSINVPDINMGEVKTIEIDEATAPKVPKDPMATYPGEFHVTGKAGSVAVINACLWHGGTTNISGKPRRILHLFIGRRDVPQQLVERDHVTPELLARTSDTQRYLLDIEGADPKITGYPPMPKEARKWAVADTPGTKA